MEKVNKNKKNLGDNLEQILKRLGNNLTLTEKQKY